MVTQNEAADPTAEVTDNGMVRIVSDKMFPYRGDTVLTPGEARDLADGVEDVLAGLENDR